MTRQEWAKRLPLIQAFVEGKTIQGKWENIADDPWEDLDSGDIEFNQKGQEYRIKPEPKVIWVNEYPDGRQIFDNKESAEKWAFDKIAVRVAVKYVEIVE